MRGTGWWWVVMALLGAMPAWADDDPLQGVWQTGCVPMGANGRHGAVMTVAFDGDAVRSTVRLHAAADCVTPTVTAAYAGQRRRWDRDGAAIALDHAVSAITLTLHGDAVAEHYNQGRNGDGCGLTGWRTEVPVVVAGRLCRPFPFPPAGAMLYDRVEAVGDALAFGSLPLAWANTGPESRPATVGQILFRRVPPPTAR